MVTEYTQVLHVLLYFQTRNITTLLWNFYDGNKRQSTLRPTTTLNISASHHINSSNQFLNCKR